MSAVAVLLVLALCGALLYKLWKEAARREEPFDRAIDPDQAIQAAIELHRIRRRLEASLTKTEQRRGATRLRREIAEALNEEP